MYFDVFDCFHDLSIQHDTTTIDVLAEVGSETDRRREAARTPAIVASYGSDSNSEVFNEPAIYSIFERYSKEM